MKWVIRILGLADGRTTAIDGKYLKYYEPRGHHGRGIVLGTEALDDAMTFRSKEAAVDLWNTQFGMRPDGKPNRPLTAYTIEILPYEADQRNLRG